ncbi:MAG: hypothetical protein AAF438_20255 [Pseudomonadota bacterium]
MSNVMIPKTNSYKQFQTDLYKEWTQGNKYIAADAGSDRIYSAKKSMLSKTYSPVKPSYKEAKREQQYAKFKRGAQNLSAMASRYIQPADSGLMSRQKVDRLATSIFDAVSDVKATINGNGAIDWSKQIKQKNTKLADKVVVAARDITKFFSRRVDSSGKLEWASSVKGELKSLTSSIKSALRAADQADNSKLRNQLESHLRDAIENYSQAMLNTVDASSEDAGIFSETIRELAHELSTPADKNNVGGLFTGLKDELAQTTAKFREMAGPNPNFRPGTEMLTLANDFLRSQDVSNLGKALYVANTHAGYYNLMSHALFQAGELSQLAAEDALPVNLSAKIREFQDNFEESGQYPLNYPHNHRGGCTVICQAALAAINTGNTQELRQQISSLTDLLFSSARASGNNFGENTFEKTIRFDKTAVPNLFSLRE